MNLKVIYEDNHIIVVVKPVGIPVQADKTGDKDMLTIIKEYLKEKYNKPGNVYLGLIHRLDRPTGGIMVFAKTSKAASRLSEQIRLNLFTKKYLAIVSGYFDEKTGVFEDYILKKEDNSSVISNLGKYAKLEYEVLKEKSNLSLVNILLHTGRHHQIRVQFASRNHPLYGDQRYGKSSKKQLALFAYYLSFNHPVTKEKLEFIKYPDKVGIWKEFIC